DLNLEGIRGASFTEEEDGRLQSGSSGDWAPALARAADDGRQFHRHFLLHHLGIQYLLYKFVVSSSSCSLAKFITVLQSLRACIGLLLCLIVLQLELASALETLCGQAYGTKQYHTLGILLDLATICSFVQQCGTLKAGTYARYLIPGLLSYALIQPLMRFLQIHSFVVPMLLCWIMIHKLGIGLSISYWINAGLFVLLVAFIPRCQQCWPGFSTEMFRDIEVFLKLAVASAIMSVLFRTSAKSPTRGIGLFDHPVSPYILIDQSFQVFFHSTRISNELGAGHVSNVCAVFIRCHAWSRARQGYDNGDDLVFGSQRSRQSL
ncbi:protein DETOXIFICATION 16-like, partial [Selaginella moellendorffii]|uniref:protein DETOXIFICATION 16-like n=1 Tax=Selaginella moellendorffii TaxID=88036 RepID=UPI000D1C8340